jgi:hypothetical protein
MISLPVMERPLSRQQAPAPAPTVRRNHRLARSTGIARLNDDSFAASADVEEDLRARQCHKSGQQGAAPRSAALERGSTKKVISTV